MILESLILLAAVIAVCVTVYRIHDNNNKHVHKWYTEGVKVIQSWSKDESIKYPVRRTSHVSQSCDSCGEKRIKLINGMWHSELEGMK